MNKTLMILLLAILAGSQMVKADESAWYGSLNFGVTLPDGDLIHEDADYAGAPTYKLKNGGIVGIGAGYAFGNGLRLEGELRARRLDAVGSTHSIEGRFGGPSTADGRLRSAALMTNLSYDFLVPNSKLRPYVKGGLGVAWNNTEADLYDRASCKTVGLSQTQIGIVRNSELLNRNICRPQMPRLAGTLRAHRQWGSRPPR